MFIMYDTVNFRLTAEDADGVDFLKETPRYLGDIGFHLYGDEEVVTGKVGGEMAVAVKSGQVVVRDGSLCKWYLGDNLSTLSRRATEDAISKLSDTLHLPMERAAVTRLDVAQNFVMRQPVEAYLSHLGGLSRARRLVQPNSLYYTRGNMLLCFYDKEREARRKGVPLNELYRGKSVLRYEQRYTRRVAASFKVSAVTGAMLYEESFYIRVVNNWRGAYNEITKINDVSLNIEAMKSVKELRRMGVLALVERAGGENAMLEQIREAQKTGILTSKQVYDLKHEIMNACRADCPLTVENGAMKELTRKIYEAAMYYR